MDAIKIEESLKDLLGHLLDGGQVIVAPFEGLIGGDRAPAPMKLLGTLPLVQVNGDKETAYSLFDETTKFKAYYTPEQEEIRRLKSALEASKAEIARLVQPKERANYTRLEIVIYTDVKDYRKHNPRASIAEICEKFGCSYGFVQRILANKAASTVHSELLAEYEANN